MGLLTREQILQAEDLAFEDVAVPEWGGTVRVRGLTGAERDQFESTIVSLNGRQSKVDTRNVRAKLAALTMIDADGKRLFSDRDVQQLGLKSAAALDRVFDAAQRLSGLSEQDIEELAGNLADGQSDGSTSA
jgi:hypothetical protein